ncbi:MAG: hypothetical protein ABR878_17175, partial [Roseiarcus sp.]
WRLTNRRHARNHKRVGLFKRFSPPPTTDSNDSKSLWTDTKDAEVRALLVQAGAARARICLDQAERNQYRPNKYFDFVNCVSNTYSSTRYLSESEQLEAAALYIAAFFIQLDHFGEIRGGGASGYGTYGVSLDEVMKAQYDLGISLLRSQNLTKEDICQVVHWITCSKLPATASTASTPSPPPPVASTAKKAVTSAPSKKQKTDSVGPPIKLQ